MIELKDISKVYKTKERDYTALKQVNLTFEPGDFAAIFGESGSGKSTFLNIVSGIDSSTDGTFFFKGEDTNKFSDQKWRETRNKEIGFIFQRFNLINHLTVIENVTLPLLLTGSDEVITYEIAMRLLKEVGLEGLEDKRASDLSGGQRQRVAIARTMIINPTVILADEPTGALDSTTAKEFMQLLQRFADGRIIIMVTHDEDLARKNANRVIRLHDGEVISDERVKEKNSEQRDYTNDLLNYEVVVTKKIMRRLKKSDPELLDDITVGEKASIPYHRKYVSNAPKFVRYIAKKNYQQKFHTNIRILLSFVVSIILLLTINLVIKNILSYNLNLFEVNNNYKQFLITQFDDQEELIESLKAYDGIDEVSMYYTHYVQDMYLNEQESVFNVQAVNDGIFSPRFVTLPEDSSHFYLKDELLYGSYPDDSGEIMVSSEFLLSRFFGLSMNKANNKDKKEVKLNSLVGDPLYVCGETILLEEEEITEKVISSECYSFKIAGIINGFYNGVIFSGNIFLSIEDFDSYVKYLKEDKLFTRADEYYETNVAFYVNDFSKLNLSQIENDLDIDIENDSLRDYQNTQNLERFLQFIYYAIFFSLLVICGTVDMNMVSSSVHERIREIGIYSSIGVSKKSVRRMFVHETVKTAFNILILTTVLYLVVLIAFRFLYPYFVVDLRHLDPLFGKNKHVVYELKFTLYVLMGAILFLFINVLVPSFKAANMRAIDALRSG